jgi:hypothetical protein
LATLGKLAHFVTKKNSDGEKVVITYGSMQQNGLIVILSVNETQNKRQNK